jgi:hypothetical protein
MENNRIINCGIAGIVAFLLAGLISCGDQNVAVLPPEKPEDSAQTDPEPEPEGGKPYAVVEIENLQTRLRRIDPEGKYYWRENLWKCALRDPVSGEHMGRWDPKNVIIHFPPKPHYKVDTYFGYADADGRVLLCEVINFPEAALQWKEDFISRPGYGDFMELMEVNVQMSGTVRLYTDSTGGKYGTLELTSLESSGSGEPVNLQLGVYTETYPLPERPTRFHFIDKDTLEITKVFYSGTDYQITERYRWIYKIQDNYTVLLSDTEDATYSVEGYFRMISDSKFEWDDMYILTAEYGPLVMTFEKENSSNN